MNLIVNGAPKSVQLESPTLQSLVSELSIQTKTVVAEVNQTIYQSASFESVVLKDNDRVELIYFMGGG